ncbi:MAG: sulfur oxidation c-type cytochrome SoxA [Pseudomonadota bacterium]
MLDLGGARPRPIPTMGWMNATGLIRACLVLGLAVVAQVARAAPEDDRLRLIDHLKRTYPDVRIEAYVDGALAFDPDAKANYDSLMAFPPFLAELEQGEKLWKTPFRDGKTYADCLPNGGRMIAGRYPMVDPKSARVVTFEAALNACRVAHGEAPYDLGDSATMGRLSAYARGLSDGMKMAIEVDGPEALAAYEAGRRTYFQRHGQLNQACANCHVHAAGQRLGQEILSPAIGQATHWPVFRDGKHLTTLQQRFASCFRRVGHVPEPIGSERLNTLEYFLATLSNGLEMKASVFRGP